MDDYFKTSGPDRRALMRQIELDVARQDLNSAVTNYNRLKSMYESFPDYLEGKKLFYNDVVILFNKIANLKAALEGRPVQTAALSSPDKNIYVHPDNSSFPFALVASIAFVVLLIAGVVFVLNNIDLGAVSCEGDNDFNCLNAREVNLRGVSGFEKEFYLSTSLSKAGSIEDFSIDYDELRLYGCSQADVDSKALLDSDGTDLNLKLVCSPDSSGARVSISYTLSDGTEGSTVLVVGDPIIISDELPSQEEPRTEAPMPPPPTVLDTTPVSPAPSTPTSTVSSPGSTTTPVYSGGGGGSGGGSSPTTSNPKLSVYTIPSNPKDNESVTLRADVDFSGSVTDIAIYFETQRVNICERSDTCSFDLGVKEVGTYRIESLARTSGGSVIEKTTFSVISSQIADNTTNDSENQTDNNQTINDTIIPTVSVSHSPSTIDTSTEVLFSASANDSSGISKIDIFVNNQLARSCSASPCIFTGGPYSEGTYTYHAVAVDNSSNKNSAKTADKTFTVVAPDPGDIAPPTISITRSPQSPDLSDTVRFTASATDNSGIDSIIIYINNIAVKTCTASPCVLDTLVGLNTQYYAKAVDSSPNKNEAVSETFSVSPSDPPSTVITTMPSSNIININTLESFSMFITNNHDNIYQNNTLRVWINNALTVETPVGPIAATGVYEEFISASFINTTLCAGVEDNTTINIRIRAISHFLGKDITSELVRNVTLICVEQEQQQDTSPPSIDVSHTPQSLDTTDLVTITATASDPSGISEIKIFVEGQSVKTCAASPCVYSGGPYTNGSYKYYATAIDNSPNKNDAISSVRYFDVLGQSPLILGFTPDASEIRLSEIDEFVFTAINNGTIDFTNNRITLRVNSLGLAINEPFPTVDDDTLKAGQRVDMGYPTSYIYTYLCYDDITPVNIAVTINSVAGTQNVVSSISRNNVLLICSDSAVTSTAYSFSTYSTDVFDSSKDIKIYPDFFNIDTFDRIEYYADDKLLGQRTDAEPFVWSNVSPGEYNIVIVALVDGQRISSLPYLLIVE